MRIALNGQCTAQSAQLVQPAASSRDEILRPASVSSESTCGSQTPMHQPQPVQRAGSITGNARRAGGLIRKSQFICRTRNTLNTAATMAQIAPTERAMRGPCALLCGGQRLNR